MNRFADAVLLCFVALAPLATQAQALSMKWGLESTRSYRETERTLDEDGAVRSERAGKRYRTFAFNERDKAVLEPMLKCLQRHEQLWAQYRKAHAKPVQAEFEQWKAEQDPACDQHAKQQAPVLYFDFVATSQDALVLEAIEIQTVRFSEYRGGGFFRQEAWYDIVLRHDKGTKRYDVSKRLAFTGTGRCELRLWSDNVYPQQGWIAPQGEYLIDIRFVFTSAGKPVSVSTGPFKIDV